MNLIVLFIAIPLGTAFLLPLLGRISKKIPDILTVLVSLTLFVLSLIMIKQDIAVYKMGGWGLVNGIPIGIYLVLDGLSILMLIIVNLVGCLVTLYSIQYMERYTAKPSFYTLFLLMIAGMNGVILSGDIFNLYVFLEISAIASYALVGFGTGKEELEASFKYMVLGIVASCFILLSIALLYSFTGTLNMADIGRIIDVKGANVTVLFVGALFLMGLGMKAAIMPFHAWLPDAHPSAPAPISAMLSGVLIKAIGVYALCRIFFNVLGLGEMITFKYVLLILGTISMIFAALLALGQQDFKRLLAYSSISQIGYIIFGIGLGTPLGILGALFHLVNHASAKSLLFLNSGAVEYSTHTRNMKKMGGLNERMPITGYTSLIGSLSIAGIPPFAGFWSKLIIIIAAIQAGQPVFAFLAILASILTLAYYLRMQQLVFWGKLGKTLRDIKEVPYLMCISMITLTILCIGLVVLIIPGIREIVLEPAVNVLLNGLGYSYIVIGG